MSKANELKKLIIPKDVARVTGQRFPKDLYYKSNCKQIGRFTLCMPDGMLISVPIYEGESVKEKLNGYIDNWYKVTKSNPKQFEHIILKNKCPICGGELRGKQLPNGLAIWCINHPDCNYQAMFDEESSKDIDHVSIKEDKNYEI